MSKESDASPGCALGVWPEVHDFMPLGKGTMIPTSRGGPAGGERKDVNDNSHHIPQHTDQGTITMRGALVLFPPKLTTEK